MLCASPPLLIVEDLRARGLNIPDSAVAVDFIRRVGARRAQNYWRPMMDGGGDDACFLSGAAFSHVAALYDFDKSLRFLSLLALEEIEIAWRADVVRCLAARDPLAHRRPEFFRVDFAAAHRRWLERHDAEARGPGRRPDAPVWESAEWWSFGMLSRLFAGMKIADRRAVAANYGDPNGTFTADSMRVLSGVRNVAAHHGRLWNTSALTLLPKAGVSKSVFGFNPPKSRAARARPYAFFCLMAHFIRGIRPGADWPARLRGLLLSDFPVDAPGLSPAQMGFPDGWSRHPFWREKTPNGK